MSSSGSQPQSQPVESINNEDTQLTLSSIILPISDDDFSNINISLHNAIFIFNELLKNEDTSQWYFLEKVHENYFPTSQKWNVYLSKISPNKPIDFHDIRKQIINGSYNKLTNKHLLNDIGSVFTNAMIRYDNDDNDDMYDESQRLLTKFQTLCSEQIEQEQQVEEEVEEEEEKEEEREEEKDDNNNDIIIPSLDDVFEIEDYYCASPWEKLISEIEKQLMAWNLHNGSMTCCIEYRQQMKNNCILSTNINIPNSDYNYILQYHDYNNNNNKNKNNRKLAIDEIIDRNMNSEDNELLFNKHEICIYFGISSFILLLPNGNGNDNNNNDYINES
eukprot:389154_1